MAKLSIKDMNNLSGINDSNLEELNKSFKQAHNRVLNEALRWCKRYKNTLNKLDKEDIKTLMTARELYFTGSIAVDRLDMFLESSNDYLSILGKLKLDEREVKAYNELIFKMKKEVISNLKHCYYVWDKMRKIFYKEEE